jgi:CDP-paratose 2-epimerase
MSNLTILITGGCGFIGSNLCILLKEKYPHYTIIAFDNLKRRGSELNIPRLQERGISFIHADIRNTEDLKMQTSLDFIIDAAAEPSVSSGLEGGSFNYVINTNLSGTINTLELAARHKARFIFLSTSRIYPISYLEKIQYTEGDTRFEIGPDQQLQGVGINGINEDFPLNKARSVYGATKLASELMIEEFREFFGVDYVINRCGVVAGPYQMGKVDQGVIALWMARYYWKKDISYFGYNGKGKQVRDVLHIQDLFALMDYELHHFDEVSGQTFNAGGGNASSVSLKELSGICASITGNTVKEHAVPDNRKGDIPIYITDNARISSTTGWAPVKTVPEIATDIFHWINNNEKELQKILNL